MTELAQIRSKFVGLTTARSPEATPPGGLLEGENGVIRKENVIECRPGFATAALPAALSSEALGRVEYPIEDNTVGFMIDSATTRRDTDGTEITKQGGGSLAWESYAAEMARRSLFCLTSDALRTIHSPSATTAYRAGVPQPAILQIDTAAPGVTGPAYPGSGDKYRAYRAVIRRAEPATGQSHIARSAPSNRALNYIAATDQNCSMTVYFHLEDDYLVGDVVELYCTEVSTTYPTDEMYLNQEVELTAAHIANGYVSILDDVPDSDLGMALYTNESREGQEGAHYRPPAAGAIGTFNNSLWLGDLTYPAEVELRYKSSFGNLFTGLYVNTSADMVGAYLIADGTFTNGLATITGLSAGDAAKMKVGMYVLREFGVPAGTGYADSWSGAATDPLIITAVGATSVTLNQTWTGATVAGRTFHAEDAIYIGTLAGIVHYPIRFLGELVRIGGQPVGVTSLGSYAANDKITVDYYNDLWGDTPNDLAPQRAVSAVITGLTPVTAPQYLWATHGDRYSPALPEPDGLPFDFEMPQEILPDHVAWSNRDEPDHYTLANIDRVGRGGSTVLCLGESRGSMLIATDRGMWRGHGNADSGISFDELNKDVRALGRRCMAGVKEYQYLAADDGVYQCDENECVNITYDRINDLESLFAAVAVDRVSSLKVVANGKDDEILVCCPPSATPDAAVTHALVFNTSTKTWMKWTFPVAVNDVTVKGPTRQLRATVNGAETELTERDRTTLADASYSTTIAAVDGDEITINAGSGWTPAVGDAIVRSSVTYLVTAIASATVFTVHTTGATTGAATGYVGIQTTITPSVNTAKTPHFMKVWAEGAIQWARRAGVYVYQLAFRSAITGLNTAATQNRQLSATRGTNTDARSAPSASRFLTPRAAARGTHLCFSILVRQALADWAIEGVSVRFRTTADKAPRQLP